MASAEITLTQRNKIPQSKTWEIPRDELYVRLGCIGCNNRVCFLAKGVNLGSPGISCPSEETQQLLDIIDEVEDKRETAHRLGINGGTGPCEGDCEMSEAIPSVVEVLNEGFGANLKVPQ